MRISDWSSDVCSSDLSGSVTRRSSSDSGGADLGLTLATIIMYKTYSSASIRPGKKSPAYNLTNDTPATAPYTIRSTDGGIIIPRQPPAVMEPAVRRMLYIGRASCRARSRQYV